MKRQICKFIAAICLTAILSAGTFAASVIRSASGANAAAIQAAVDTFRADLGGSNNAVGGSFTSGRREVNWDATPAGFSQPNTLPFDFFGFNSARGLILQAHNGVAGQQTFRVSAATGSGFSVRFGDIDPSYSSTFQFFSTEKIFHAVGTNKIEVKFVIPNTSLPASGNDRVDATVSGFGAVFLDADGTNSYIEYFDKNGKKLETVTVPASNNGLSFVGVSFNAGERVASVKIGLGNAPLAAGNVDGTGGVDVVALDDFIYGEPRAATMHTADFDGDGTSDYSIFRPSTGAWFVLNSGSNTVTAVGFGQNGDIPVDGDFDGDQRTDVTVFRPSNGTWFRLNSSNGAFVVTPFGTNGDKPAPGDFDKDGKTDISVYRPSTGDYFSLKSSDGSFVATHWGATGDIPIGGAAQ